MYQPSFGRLVSHIVTYRSELIFPYVRLYTIIYKAILNLFIPLNRAFPFYKNHFTDLYLPFLQSRLFSR